MSSRKRTRFDAEKREKYLDIMITQYAIKKLGYDLMGYIIERKDQLSYHHIVPVSCGGKTTLENGCPLIMGKSHPYIHVVEKYNPMLFKYISDELMKMKELGHIDFEILMAIHEMLCDFEDQFDGKYNEKNHLIIRPEFKVRIQKMVA